MWGFGNDEMLLLLLLLEVIPCDSDTARANVAEGRSLYRPLNVVARHDCDRCLWQAGSVVCMNRMGVKRSRSHSW